MNDNIEEPQKKRGRFQMSPLLLGILCLALIGFYFANLVNVPTATTTADSDNITDRQDHHIARVIDGDTAWFDGRRKRIWGIDAPDQGGDAGEYFQQSTAALEQAAQYAWICEDTGEISRGRDVTKCYFHNGAGDIGEWMVRAGYAVDWPQFSGGAYQNAQREAQAEKRGIWQTHNKSWR